MCLLSKQVTCQLSLSRFHSARKTTPPFCIPLSTWHYSTPQSYSNYFWYAGVRLSNYCNTNFTWVDDIFSDKIKSKSKSIENFLMEIRKRSRKFCSEGDKEKFAINFSYFMLCFLNIQQWAHLDPNSPFFGSVTSNTNAMEKKKQVLDYQKHKWKKNISYSSYIAYKTAFSCTNSEYHHFL